MRAGVEVVHRADVLAPQVHLESLGPVPLGRVAFASRGCLLQFLALVVELGDVCAAGVPGGDDGEDGKDDGRCRGYPRRGFQ